MKKEDLVGAKDDYETAKGFADFHSLRHTFISLAIAGGATTRVAMELARHSNPSLTFGRYGHAYLGDLKKSLDGLPSFNSKPEHQTSELRRTGTDDQPVTKPEAELDKNVWRFAWRQRAENHGLWRTLTDR